MTHIYRLVLSSMMVSSGLAAAVRVPQTACGLWKAPQPATYRDTRIYAHLRTCNGYRDAPWARPLARLLRPSAARRTAEAAAPRAESMTKAPPGPVVPAVGALHPLSGVK